MDNNKNPEVGDLVYNRGKSTGVIVDIVEYKDTSEGDITLYTIQWIHGPAVKKLHLKGRNIDGFTHLDVFQMIAGYKARCQELREKHEPRI